MLEDLFRKVNPPDAPGVYIMRDVNGKIIYIGKARSLKKRIHSYFRPVDQLEPKTKALVQKIVDIELMITDSELEALVLECTLIKKYRPRYNVIMRDDKSYPYLKLTVQEPFPRLLVTRKPFVDEARYFGPFVKGNLWDAVRAISLHFGLRLCKLDLKPGETIERACLYAQMEQCGAACRGIETQEYYQTRVRKVLEFLQGGQDTLSPVLEQRMQQAAQDQQFEAAAKWRDSLRVLEILRQKAVLSSTGREDRDVLNLAHSGTSATVEIFTIRSGNLEGRRHYFLQHVSQNNAHELLAHALTQYYSRSVSIPPEILVPEMPEEVSLIQDWLSQQVSLAVKIRLPQNEDEQRLMHMAETNAWLYLKHQDAAEEDEPSAIEIERITELGQRLDITRRLDRIECYDISNISGQDAVGSQVVFTKGRSDRAQYRRYRIKSVEGPNDFAMLQEVLYRRLKRLKDGTMPIPDLLVIDGGAGQVSAVLKVLKDLEFDIPIIGLAKKREEIYRPGSKEPLRLPLESPAIQLLTQLRDEAHRFAISYHRKVRGKRMQLSVLDKVEGLGPAKRKILLRTFGSVEALLQVSETDISALPGINLELARRIQSILKKER